jgi:hypothetical protein
MEQPSSPSPINHLYTLFNKFFTHHTIIPLDNKFTELMQLESIILDESTFSLISPSIKNQILTCIEEYDCAFIKVNAKCGIDASFTLVQMKCFTLDHIITLIKSSNKILNNYNYTGNKNNYLIIKEWYNIDKRNEFRCFIVNGVLKGITQRYINSYYEYDKEEIIRIKKCIVDFVKEDTFAKAVNAVEYGECKRKVLIVDVVYLQRKNKVKVIDVEVYNENEKLKEDKGEEEEEEEEEEENVFKLYKDVEEVEMICDDVELRYIESMEDERIEKKRENKNRFPIELYGTDINTLINSLNTSFKDEESNK